MTIEKNIHIGSYIYNINYYLEKNFNLYAYNNYLYYSMYTNKLTKKIRSLPTHYKHRFA